MSHAEICKRSHWPAVERREGANPDGDRSFAPGTVGRIVLCLISVLIVFGSAAGVNCKAARGQDNLGAGEADQSANAPLAGKVTVTYIQPGTGQGGEPARPQAGAFSLFHHWALTWQFRGGPAVQVVAADAAGNVYVAGKFRGTVDFDPGPGKIVQSTTDPKIDDVYVSKFDNNGTYQWTRTFGGKGYDTVYALSVSKKGTIYVIGEFRGTVDFDPTDAKDVHKAGEVKDSGFGPSHIFLTAYDQAGNYLWTRAAGGLERTVPRGATVDTHGNIYVVGHFRGKSFLGDGRRRTSEGSTDMFITKYAPDGKCLSVRTIGSSAGEDAYNVVCGADGLVYVGGTCSGPVDFDPGPGQDIQGKVKPDDGYTYFVSCYTPDGDYKWTRIDVGYRIAALPGGGLVVATGTRSEKGSAITLAGWNPDGKELWSRKLQGTKTLVPARLAVDSRGNSYLLGYYQGVVDFDPGPKEELSSDVPVGTSALFLSSYDKDGGYGWTTLLLGASPRDLATSGDDVILAGWFSGQLDLDPTAGEDVRSIAGGGPFLLKWGSSRPAAPVRKAAPDQGPKLAIVALSSEEPDQNAKNGCRGLLVREICRQAFLLAAREELDMGTRDLALREYDPDAPGRVHTYRMGTSASVGDRLEVTLLHPADPGKWVIRVDWTGDKAVDYLGLIELAADWSRDAFPGILTKQGLRRAQPAPAGRAFPLPDDLAHDLNQLTFLKQYAALRRLHDAVRSHGESPALAGALVRCYANLGVLTQFHWNASSKVFAARSLLYAERLLKQHPEAADALQYRAYARALAGFHAAALPDLAAAEKKLKPDEALFPWASPIRQYCEHNEKALRQSAGALPDHAQLALLLRALVMEVGFGSPRTVAAYETALKENPECYRLHDALCDEGGVAVLHVAIARPFAVMASTLPKRLKEIPDLPQAVKARIATRVKTASGRAAIVRELVKAGNGADRTAANDPSWTMLGRMIEEVTFCHVQQRAWFLRDMLGVDAAGFVRATLPAVADHPYLNLIKSYSFDPQSQRADMNTLVTQTEFVDLSRDMSTVYLLTAELFIKHSAFGPAGRELAASHADATDRDLMFEALSRHSREGRAAAARQLIEVSPYNPFGYAALLDSDWERAAAHAEQWEKRFPEAPCLLYALAKRRLAQDNEAEGAALVNRLAKLDPAPEYYRLLARFYQRKRQVEKCVQTMEKIISLEGTGLARARARADIAEYLMSQKEWKRAEPYATAAARSGAAWAMMTAISCHGGLGDLDRATPLVKALSERYTAQSHLWLVWCLRTGKGDSAAARQSFKQTQALTREQQRVLALTDPDPKAAAALGRLAHPELHGDQVVLAAMAAWAAKDIQTRDAYLANVVRFARAGRGIGLSIYHQDTAKLMQRALRTNTPLDVKAMEETATILEALNDNYGAAAQVRYLAGLFQHLSANEDSARACMKRSAETSLGHSWTHVAPALAAEWLRQHSEKK